MKSSNSEEQKYSKSHITAREMWKRFSTQQHVSCAQTFARGVHLRPRHGLRADHRREPLAGVFAGGGATLSASCFFFSRVVRSFSVLFFFGEARIWNLMECQKAEKKEREQD